MSDGLLAVILVIAFALMAWVFRWLVVRTFDDDRWPDDL